MKNGKSARSSGFELLRIIMMLQIIFLHFCGIGDFKERSLALGGADEFLYYLTYLMSRCPVYVFVLLSGYFLCNKDVSMKYALGKAKDTYLSMAFYSIPMMCVAMPIAKLIVPQYFEHGAFFYILSGLFPFLGSTWYYMTLFIILLLCSPFIAKALKDISKKTYSAIVGVMFVLTCIWPMLCELEPFSDIFQIKNIMLLSDGKSLICFLFMYILGGWLGRYSKEIKLSPWICGAAFFVLGAANLGLLYLIPQWKDVAFWNNNPFAVLQAVALILLFGQLDFHSKAINAAAAVAMDVYLIHWMPGVREVFFGIYNANRLGDAKSPLFWVLVVLGGVVIFALCGCIGAVRMKIFDAVRKTVAAKKGQTAAAK